MAPKPHYTLEHSQVTVGVVTYNSEAHIAGCLESIEKYLAVSIPSVIVIDNASTDNTLKVIYDLKKRYLFPITVNPQSKNNGYAWAINRICESIKTDWICLINPDARLLSDAFPAARELARRVPTCGVIGGILSDADGNPQECGGVFPTPLMVVWDWCGLRHLFPRPGWRTTLKLDLPPDASPRKIDYPTGAFWIFRREIYKRVGPFDERFFLYFEETDFCRRAKDLGWPSFIMPSIRVKHIRGASIDASKNDGNFDPLAIYFESMIIYLSKHFHARRVRAAVKTIETWLRFRRWVRKDEKSEHIFKAFHTGLEKARAAIEIAK
jgi:N-acetylglucosaminyl-diphospho-decaprenol L-rhamnosyltransferase